MVRLCAFLALAVTGSAARPAHAAASTAGPAQVGAETSAETPAPYPPVRAGAIAGVGFPRPISFEGLVQLWEHVAVGVEYGLLPSVTVSGVQASMWSIAGDARWLPWRGPLFVGVRAGVQHAEASATIPVSGWGPVSETLGLDASFINPRIGLLWVFPCGVVLGFDAGIQIPLSTSTTSTWPLSLVPTFQGQIDALERTVLPTVDLLQIGFVM